MGRVGASPTSPVGARLGGMKVLAWNLNTNRGAVALDRLLARHEPDVVLLQESARPAGAGRIVKGALVPDSRWGSWVVARAVRAVRVPLPAFDGWVAGARLTTDAGVAYVFSVHTPGNRPGVRRGSYTRVSRSIVDAIVACVPARATLVIGGDFNIAMAEPVAGEARPLASDERAALAAFRAHGFRLAWRDTNPGVPRAQTLRWMREPTTPYHCDGFLVRGRRATIVSCQVIDDRALHARSDHNPVLLEVQLNADSASRDAGSRVSPSTGG